MVIARAEGVTHAQTVPRNMVHRESVHEVLLTDSVEAGADRYLVGVQWPRNHCVTGPDPAERLDGTLILEAIRQIGLYLTHRYLGIPVSARFVAQQLGFRWTAEAPRFGGGPINAVAVVTTAERRAGRGPAAGLRLDIVFHSAHSAVATGVGELRCVAPDLYMRLRGPVLMDSTMLSPPDVGVAPALVGRTHPAQVVLHSMRRDTDTRMECSLRVDRNHPCFFDHPQDHLPANLIVEAIRQAATLTLPAPTHEIRALHAAFRRFTDVGAPVTVGAERKRDGIEVTIGQHGAVTALGRVATSTLSSASIDGEAANVARARAAS